jgi:hypothetical protein
MIEKITLQKAQQVADAYRKEHPEHAKTGVVVVFNGEVQGWMNELRNPSHWVAGCIAVSERDDCWIAVGGTEQDGAMGWGVINTIPAEGRVVDIDYILRRDLWEIGGSSVE